jgi:hypothetical protein
MSLHKILWLQEKSFIKSIKSLCEYLLTNILISVGESIIVFSICFFSCFFIFFSIPCMFLFFFKIFFFVFFFKLSLLILFFYYWTGWEFNFIVFFFETLSLAIVFSHIVFVLLQCFFTCFFLNLYFLNLFF